MGKIIFLKGTFNITLTSVISDINLNKNESKSFFIAMIIRRYPNSTLLNPKHHRSVFPWIHNCPLCGHAFVPNIRAFLKTFSPPNSNPMHCHHCLLRGGMWVNGIPQSTFCASDRCLGFVFNYNTLTHMGSLETLCFKKNLRLRPNISILHKVSAHILLLSNANWGLEMTLISYQGIPARGHQTRLRVSKNSGAPDGLADLRMERSPEDLLPSKNTD